MNKKLSARLIIFAPYLLLLGIWAYFSVFHAIPYWQETGDYSWYSMSYAFSFESWFAGRPATNLAANIHPGVPFGVVSWLALRLATLGQGLSSAQRIVFPLHHAETFWLCAKLMALLLNFAGIYALRLFLGRNSAAFWLGGGCYFAITTAAFDPGLVQLSNESFTLLFVAASYMAIYRFFGIAHRPPPPINTLSGAAAAPVDVAALAIGALGAVGWSIKVYYLAPSVGFAAGLAAAISTGAVDRRVLTRGATLAAATFLVLSILIIWKFMDFHAFYNWVVWNWGMLTHVDRYGTGQSGIANTVLMIQALSTLYQSTGGRFPLVLMVLLIGFLAVVAAGSRSASWRRENLPYSMAVLTGFLINLFGLLKHYAPHYALPVVATLCCMLPTIGALSGGRRGIRVASVVIALPLVLNVYDFYVLNSSKLDDAKLVVSDVAEIQSLPLAPGKKRVWGYYSPVESGEIPMIDGYAQSTLVSGIIAGFDPADVSPASVRDASTWEYVMFPKSYFPTKASIAKNYPHQFDFALTNFKPLPDDQIQEYRKFFVLTRK